MSERVINICFHGVGHPRRGQEPGEDLYWVGVDQYHRILDEVAGWPGVRLSFDDGNVTDVEHGLPGLVERGLTATFFPVAGRIDEAGSLSADQIRELVAADMRIGTHGMRHVPWRGLDAAERRAELVDARARIAEVAGRPVQEAALPLGRYDRRLLAELRRLGYTRVYSSDRRKTMESAWFQPRFSVTREDDPASLRARALRDPGPAQRAKLVAVGFVKRVR